MQGAKTATVLIAEPSTEAKRNEASRQAVAAAVANVAESTGGHVLKTIGGKLMVIFATPDAAASAASKMQAKIDGMPPVEGVKVGVQIAFDSGPVNRGSTSVADDTVKLALKLVGHAHDGQTITSQRTAQQLNPAFRDFSKPLRQLGERTGGVPVCEIASWHQRGVRPSGWAAMAVLALTCGEQFVVCSREKETVVVGRGDNCDLIVASLAASREHCTIEYCRGEFLVKDHSSNGTFVTVAERSEVAVRTARLALPEQGVISIGEPRSRTSEPIGFGYALVT